jgi:hypothetical protein
MEALCRLQDRLEWRVRLPGVLISPAFDPLKEMEREF